VERPAIEVTDEMVDGQLDRLRERVAQLEVIGRPRWSPRRWAGRAS
jgi:FKBP-type peptidyl-prolyl cis-trans isomerase (trigger factor)